MNGRAAAAAMRQFKQGQPQAVLRAVRRGMRLMEKFAKTEFMVRGAWYPTKPSQGQRQDPPNPPPGPLKIRSGRLARTIRTDTIRFDGTKVRTALVAGNGAVRYARIHEHGGLTGAGHAVLIRPRPYLGPARDKGAPFLLQYVRDEQKKLALATLRGLARVKG